MHLIEHVEDVIATMEELHRVARPGGTIFIVTPHYSDLASYTDPTHRRHLSSESFHYFYAGGLHGRGDVVHAGAASRDCACTSSCCGLWRLLGFEFLVNHARWFRRFWEYYLSFVIRGKVMEFTFEVVK